MAAVGNAFDELRRRAEVAGVSEEEYLATLLAQDVSEAGGWSREDWARILEPAERAIREGRFIDGRVARERLEEYMRERRER